MAHDDVDQPRLPPTSSRKLNILVLTGMRQSEYAHCIAGSHMNLALDRICALKNVQMVVDTSKRNVWLREEIGKDYNGQQQASRVVAETCQWADLLILFPFCTESIARMLQGLTDGDIRLHIVRCWDATKKILLVPGMNTMAYESPITRKQLSKLKRKWNWVRVVPAVLWQANDKKPLPWDGEEELVESVRTEIDLKTIGQDLDIHPAATTLSPTTSGKKSARPTLPPELWSIVLDYTGDWELATALNVHTTLPVPPEWQQSSSEDGPQTLNQRLEWAILVGTTADVAHILQDSPTTPRWWFSRLCIKLIMRFSKTALLAYLEESHKEIFWCTFGSTFLPNKASAAFGKIDILEFWKQSPSFLTKEYTEETLDGASRSGFIHVLEWWRNSGLPLRYTEAAMEQASSQGHIDVLDWWKNAANPPASSLSPLKVKPGKSISFATQSGSLSVLRWWIDSTIPFPYEDTVAKLASAHGHVHILDYWKQLRGEKMLYDHQVLANATKMGHADVLEWWRTSGLRVEYKTYDIEEALEDGVEGPKGDAVRRWWAKNGLNLGITTSEWMKTQVLGQV